LHNASFIELLFVLIATASLTVAVTTLGCQPDHCAAVTSFLEYIIKLNSAKLRPPRLNSMSRKAAFNLGPKPGQGDAPESAHTRLISTLQPPP